MSYTFTPSTDLDFASIRVVGAALLALATMERNIVLNLRDVDFMDSAGAKCIGRLSELLLAQGRSLVVVSVQPQPSRLMTMLRIAH